MEKEKVFKLVIKDEFNVVASILLIPASTIYHISLLPDKGMAKVLLKDQLSDMREANIKLLDKQGKETQAHRPSWIFNTYQNYIDLTDQEAIKEIVTHFHSEDLYMEFLEIAAEIHKMKLERQQKALENYIANQKEVLKMEADDPIPERKEEQSLQEYYKELAAFFKKVADFKGIKVEDHNTTANKGKMKMV